MVEQERGEKERVEQERVEQEREALETERGAQERGEQKRVKQERVEQGRVDQERRSRSGEAGKSEHLYKAHYPAHSNSLLSLLHVKHLYLEIKYFIDSSAPHSRFLGQRQALVNKTFPESRRGIFRLLVVMGHSFCGNINLLSENRQDRSRSQTLFDATPPIAKLVHYQICHNFLTYETCTI